MTQEEVSVSDVIYMGLVVFGMIFMALFLILFSISINYLNYKYYESEGYKARFKDLNCEIKIRNIDGKSSWEICDNIGNNFVLENYGVKR